MFYLIIIFCYIITAYGACNVIVFGDGPFYIFSKIREVTYNIHPHYKHVRLHKDALNQPF